MESELSQLVTVVVAPREKLSVLTTSLKSLFETIPEDVPVLICMPELPSEVRAETQSLLAERPASALREFQPDCVPHHARLLGAREVETPWMVFADNDLHYETGWLEALGREMKSGEAEVLAPLIYIGPPAARTIHHAGGILNVDELPGGRRRVTETHRFMNADVTSEGIRSKIASDQFRSCDVAEFHCLALRTELLDNPVTLPEQLITREQQDLALQCRKHGLRVRFVHDAGVTYMAGTHFRDCDLVYHARRWSEKRAAASLDYMETAWNMDFDRQRVLYKWIEQHRRRPFRKRHKLPLRYLPGKLEGAILSRIYGYTL